MVVVPEYRPSTVDPFPAQMQTAKPLYVMCAAMPNGWMLILIASHYSVTLLAAIPYLWQGFYPGDREPDTPDYGETSAEVRCIIDWYGPTDFVKMNYYRVRKITILRNARKVWNSAALVCWKTRN